LRVAGSHTAATRDAHGPETAAIPHAQCKTIAILLGCGLVVAISGCQAPASADRDVKAVNITSVRRQLEFTARVRDQEQKSKVGVGETKSKEQIFEENVKIETQGSVYHPNFMEFSLAGLFGLLQKDFERQFDDRLRTSSDDGDVLEFDFEGHFLKKKPYPGTVYARRYRSLVPRPFLSSLQTTTTNYGFVWQYVDAKTPTSLQFNSTDVQLEPLDKTEKPGRQQNTSLRFDTSYRFSDYNVLSFTFDRRSVKERPFDLQYDSNELTLGHRWDFGDHHQYRLDSALNYFDQIGTFDIRRTRWRETLRLTHTETLRSWYQFEILDRTQGSLSGVAPIKETSYYASGTLEHRLYESLVSQLFGFAQYQDFDQGLKITRLGVQPSFDYRKKNPWGALLGNYSFRVQTDDRTGSGLDLEVVDERGTFSDPEPVVLSNINVQLSSIVVTSEDRVTNYRSGEDYRVRVVGDRVEIERVPTGRILDGQTVLIDYVWMLGGDFKLDTVMHNFGLRQNFDFGLSPYYRLRRQDQTVTPADATGVRPEDIRANIYGTEYQKGPLRLVAELENHESNINPFDALRMSADLTHHLKNAGTARLRTRWVDIDRSAPLNRRTKLLTVEGRYRQRVGEYLIVEGATLYRRENDSLSGDRRGLDVDLSLEWVIRDTELRVTFEYGRFEDDFAENKNQTLFVQFRRRF
jgi:hypothetical protein